MSETAQFRYNIADYMLIGANIEFMSYFTQLDENPTAQIDEVHFVNRKTSTKNIKSYAPVFPIMARMYTNNAVLEYLRDIGQEHKTGENCQTDYYRVDLLRPISGKDNTYYARKFTVSIEISGITGNGGEAINIAGNLNGIADVVIGEFNTSTKAFTTTAELGTLSVASVAGSTTGKTRIIVLPVLTGTDTYVYSTAASVSIPTYGQSLAAWTDWDGVAYITATTGHDIVIAEVDGDDKAVKAGKAVVTSASE